MPKPVLHELPINFVMKILETAAASRSRCPTGSQISGAVQAEYGSMKAGFSTTKVETALAHTGHIRIEVYGRNWRVIEIMSGPNRGARTMGPPHGGKPYKVIGPRSTLDA